MEHLVIVPDGSIQKITGSLIQGGGVFWIFLIQNTVRFLLIGCVAVNDSDLQLLGRVGIHDLSELIIVQLSHRYGRDRKDGVEAANALLPLDLFNLTPVGGGNLGNVGQGIVNVGLVATIGLLVEVIQNIDGKRKGWPAYWMPK